MNAGRLLGLYPRRWRQRYGAEITEILEHERLTAQFAIDLVRGAIDAHLHPELAAPLLAAAGGGTVQVPPGSPRMRVYVLTIVLLLLLVFGGLYAYRAQTPSLPPIPVTRALGEVQAGRVKSIEIVGSYATLTLVDGSRQRVTVPDKPPQDLLTGAVDEHNRTDPAHRVQLQYRSSGDFDPLALIIPPLLTLLFTFLPISLLALLVLVLARRLSRGERKVQNASRYEWLVRIADLRDRGVLTEEEFQREKERLLE
jgi:hypothetical protein